MDNSANKGKEAYKEGLSEQKPKLEHRYDSKEIKDASEAGRSAYVEAVGLEESVETTGKVTEILKEHAAEDKTSQGAKTATAQQLKKQFDPAQIRAQLLNNLPSENRSYIHLCISLVFLGSPLCPIVVFKNLFIFFSKVINFVSFERGVVLPLSAISPTRLWA